MCLFFRVKRLGTDRDRVFTWNLPPWLSLYIRCSLLTGIPKSGRVSIEHLRPFDVDYVFCTRLVLSSAFFVLTSAAR